MKIHLIWDLDGTLVNSEPEILTTIQQALATAGLSVTDAKVPLRIGPPLPTMLRTAFGEAQLSEERLSAVIKAFRQIYDASDFEATVPFEGIDALIHDSAYVHHVITNKPLFATRRILEKKGWGDCIEKVLTPDAQVEILGHPLTKPELFETFRTTYPDVQAVGIGDMANDAACAKTVGLPAIGVLWGTGTRAELQAAGCDAIVSNVRELRESIQTIIR